MESMSRNWYNLQCEDQKQLTNCSFDASKGSGVRYCAGPDTDATIFPELEGIWLKYDASYWPYANELQHMKEHERNTVLVRYEDIVFNEDAAIKFLQSKLPMRPRNKIVLPSAHVKPSSEKEGPSSLSEYRTYLAEYRYLNNLETFVVNRVLNNGEVMKLSRRLAYPSQTFGLNGTVEL